MTSIDLSPRTFSFAVTTALRAELDARIDAYNAEQAKFGYTGRASYQYAGGVVTMEVSRLPIYQGDESELAKTIQAATQVWLHNRVWMNVDGSKGYKKIGYVYKGNLANCVGFMVWFPKAPKDSREFGVTSWDRSQKATFKKKADAVAWLTDLAAKHPGSA